MSRAGAADAGIDHADVAPREFFSPPGEQAARVTVFPGGRERSNCYRSADHAKRDRLAPMRVGENVPQASRITIGQLRASDNLIRQRARRSEELGGRGQTRSEQKSRRTKGNQDFWPDRAN